jgi:hypothetical protein
MKQTIRQRNAFGLNSTHKHAQGLHEAARRENIKVAVLALAIVAALLLAVVMGY